MKVSYKTLKRYIKDIKSPEEIASDLIMHTAEVESIENKSESLKSVLTGKLKSYEKVEGSEKLHVGQFDFGKHGIKQIIFGSVFGLQIGEVYPIAIAPTVLPTGIEIKKTKMLGVESFGMVCTDEELGTSYTNEGLIRFPSDTELGIPAINIINGGEQDIILEIDNKAINHRPDMFSHIGVIREIDAINDKKFEYKYEDLDFSELKELNIKNDIPKEVKRYIGLKVENVANIESPEYIKELLNSQSIESKGLLIDITNYSLYLYGQPTHCFDADKISGDIIIRYARSGENFLALDKKEYKLETTDIVIADNEKILALGGVIGGAESAVSQNTKNIVIEGAHFKHSTVRKTGKRLGIRTDSLNVFEKDLLPIMAKKGVSLIVSELQKILWDIKLVSYKDLYSDIQKEIVINYDLEFINNLIGKQYSKKEAEKILHNLDIKLVDPESSSGGYKKIIIPFWRKDLEDIAEIAEEIARIDGYDKIESTITKLNLGAVIQDNIYKIKRDSRNFLCDRGFYEIYNYSFVNAILMSKLDQDTENLIKLENELSEELTHMRASLIPNLMGTLEKNILENKDLKIFEIEKVFKLDNKKQIQENYEITGLIINDKDLVYYDLQNELIKLFKYLGIDNYFFDKDKDLPSFYHKGRTSKISIRGKSVGYLGEIHPKIAKNFDINNRIGFFTINLDDLISCVYNIIKTKEISQFQENNFDISFVVDKNTKGKDIITSIKKSDNNITKVELFDIYEDEEKLAGKRSLSFTVFIQSTEKTLNDEDKNIIIKNIVEKVEKKGAKLR